MQRFTPLMLANACGQLKVMQYLLDAGANVNIITNVSQTKLVLVVSAFKSLLFQRNITVLHMACYKNDTTTALNLIRQGADICIRDQVSGEIPRIEWLEPVNCFICLQ
jgi:ankyrin repeat protein